MSRLGTVALTACVAFSSAPVFAAKNIDVRFENATAMPNTMKGEVRVKVSVDGVDNASIAQITLNFEGDLPFKSIQYLKDENNPDDGSYSTVKVDKNKLIVSIVSNNGIDFSNDKGLFILTFGGSKDYAGKTVTLSLSDLENTYCTVGTGNESEDRFPSGGDVLELTANKTANVGVEATIRLVMDKVLDFSEDGNAGISVKIINKDGEVIPAEIDNKAILSGGHRDGTTAEPTFVVKNTVIADEKYTIEVSGIGYVTCKKTGIKFGKTITFTVNSFSSYVVVYNGATVAADEITPNVTVAFEAAATKANEYDIVLKAAEGKKINGFMTADLTFALTQGTGRVEYTIEPAANIDIIPHGENGYEFNFDGVNAHNVTSDKVVIGRVVFGGYCQNAKFAIADADTNIVNTTRSSSTIVEHYTAGGEKQLVVTSIDPLTIKEETKELTISIEFPNKVNANVAAYQDMKVSIAGADYKEDIALGDEMVDGKYTITRELVKNRKYTVTVSGAGYRTALYRVDMTEDKKLKFWNDAKLSAENVEDGNNASAKTVTFLAGELVNDNQINIYDLSAVVSYFDVSIDATTFSQYARYDLNRDGKVASKDVALVLAVWHK